MLNKKCQGLPIQFIIIAALGIIVLVLIALFLFSGFRTDVVDSQSAANTCASKCLSLQRAMSTAKEGDAFKDTSGYCNSIEIKGQGVQTCDKLSPCRLVYAGGECTVACGTTASCVSNA